MKSNEKRFLKLNKDKFVKQILLKEVMGCR